MCSYYQSAEELANVLNCALSISEGDFTLTELKKAFELVLIEQANIIDDQETPPPGDKE